MWASPSPREAAFLASPPLLLGVPLLLHVSIAEPDVRMNRPWPLARRTVFPAEMPPASRHHPAANLAEDHLRPIREALADGAGEVAEEVVAGHGLALAVS